MTFDFSWPWFGAALSLLLLVLLFGTTLFRTTGLTSSRWHDTRWLAVLLAPLYAVHQFEEHGIDLFGVAYAFRGTFCVGFGFPEPSTCPVPPSFLTAVNVGTVWGATALAAVLGRGRPIVALSGYGIPLVNAATHIIGAAVERAYNPGLFTAVVLFLPACAWALSEGWRQGIGRWGIAAVVLGGAAVHLVLLASLAAHVHRWMDTSTLDGVQIVDAFVPLALALAMSRVVSRRGQAGHI